SAAHRPDPSEREGLEREPVQLPSQRPDDEDRPMRFAGPHPRPLPQEQGRGVSARASTRFIILLWSEREATSPPAPLLRKDGGVPVPAGALFSPFAAVEKEARVRRLWRYRSPPPDRRVGGQAVWAAGEQ